MSKIGVQTNGSSCHFTKKMAQAALDHTGLSGPLERVADIGGGAGELTGMLAPRCKEIWLVDYAPPGAGSFPSHVKLVQADLNEPWLLPDSYFDFTFSLECIEHVENPRHFMRGAARITKPGGYIFVSTPNNHSWASKLTFLVRGQHRLFQEASYPAHVTALLKCDFERMASELGLKIVLWIYSNTDTLPKIHVPINLPGSAFSVCVGVLFQKPAQG